MMLMTVIEDYKSEATSDIRNPKNAKLEGSARVLHLRRLWREASRRYYINTNEEFKEKRKEKRAKYYAQCKLKKAQGGK